MSATSRWYLSDVRLFGLFPWLVNSSCSIIPFSIMCSIILLFFVAWTGTVHLPGPMFLGAYFTVTNQWSVSTILGAIVQSKVYFILLLAMYILSRHELIVRSLCIARYVNSLPFGFVPIDLVVLVQRGIPLLAGCFEAVWFWGHSKGRVDVVRIRIRRRHARHRKTKVCSNAWYMAPARQAGEVKHGEGMGVCARGREPTLRVGEN